ncbi:WhiB family transcriptional regulator [Streptomyces sp. NBC_00063]|uniref:WhiB family transcriptional regulator n=1 Tax=Streptomyces sp. NBC_00063 TaxID=2975638 RepID=UPI003D71BA46
MTIRHTNFRRATPNPAPAASTWRARGACRDDPDAMFPDGNKEGIAAAKEVCGPCPVRRQCLRDAIETRDTQWGIRAGLTPQERNAVVKEVARRRAKTEAVV